MDRQRGWPDTDQSPASLDRPTPNVLPLADSLVFTTDKGNPIHATNLLPVLRADLAAAGLPRVRIHDLRHAYATIMLAEGIPLPTISAVLGHSTIRVTMDIYASVVQESKQEAADAMQRALG